ncbi:bifunctional (p)ppGpp synthetase/guanosine-3',5'-bis(diphosphate) 3'-pyrophosphohydrolase [Candidatus Falkowbacteria bacterium]|jgi:(p)ppGpp synthase/HD superfamily hydrolase|nr:bifunctional (p)ppGpp synthetase/guanosine-3',5'-bis(diphosphate) 3'-pyrophosphohydrolase [Candidatus Falkowbacteria bacterium]MBT4432860.1 bifunctional (p)ppGpp synthetase/guanosine-3',5'-bis(diphosphate) 3'-pyrophosphohydrolase [Candidatus Falkowbacteria bacterium]
MKEEKEKIDEYRHEKPRESLYLWALSQGSLMPNPLPQMNKASWLVLKYHKDEKRDDGSHYSSHPSDACRIGLNFGLADDATLAGILLHDTKENNKTTDEELRQEFNDEVANIVDNQTKRPGETNKEYYARIATNVKSIIGKGCDRLSNLGTMIGPFPIPRIKKQSEETKKYVLPMLEEARHKFSEYNNIIVALRDETERILKVIDAYVESQEENEKLRQLLKEKGIEVPKKKNVKYLSPDELCQIDKESVDFTPLAETVQNLG